MALYKYRAMSKDGKINSGQLEASSTKDAMLMVRGQGLTPIEIVEDKGQAASLGSLPFFGKFMNRKKKELGADVLSHFCRQLSVIMDSGISTIKGLQVLKLQVPDKNTRSEIERMINAIERGLTISESMEEPASLFPPILAGMVKAGESTGKIDIVLRSMADYYEKENMLQKKVKSAAVYPMIVLAMALVLVIFFVNFLLPMVINIVETSGGELFFLTKAIIAISFAIKNYFYIIIPLLFLAFMGIKNFFSKETLVLCIL